MRFEKYIPKAMRTINKELDRKERLGNAAMGLAGETGEVVDQIKKNLYQGHMLNLAELEEEIGDVMWYMALLLDTTGLSMEKILKNNVEKLEKRYKKGFTVEESVNREG